MLQIISKPTRIANKSATIIDHIITSSINPTHKSVILTSKISDHFPVIYFPDLCINATPKPEFVESRDFSFLNLDRFRANLLNLNWNSVIESNDTQTAFNNFSTLFFNLYDLYFPIVCKKFDVNYHRLENWMTRGILISRKEKIRLCNISLNHPSIYTKSKFKTYRNLYNKVICTAKKIYYEAELVKHQSNLKKLGKSSKWLLTKNLVNLHP